MSLGTRQARRRKYSAVGETRAPPVGPTPPPISILLFRTVGSADDSFRPLIYSISAGSDDIRFDDTVVVKVRTFLSASGSSGVVTTAQPLDPDTPPSLGTLSILDQITSDPSVIDSDLLTIAGTGRIRVKWVAAPGSELRMPFESDANAEGILLQMFSGPTVQYKGTVLFME